MERHRTLIAYLFVGLTFVFGLLLFNIRIDEGGDDSTYICRALDFIASGRYTGDYQGALYPLFLAPFVGLFGVNLFVLKFTSLLLIVGGQVLWYETLKNRVSAGLLFSVMGLLSINSWYLFYASQTYSEALFILIEYAVMWGVLRFDDIPNDQRGRKREFKQWKVWRWALLTGLFITLAFMTRTVGIGLVAATAVYFLFRLKWQRAVMTVAGTVLCVLLWTGVRTAVWGEVKKSDQLTMLMQKHPYQPEDGKETISGYFDRVIQNSKLYISKHLMRICGFKEREARTTSGMLTWIVYVIFGYGAYCAYKKNRVLLYMAICSSMMIGATFVILQPLWDQHRLIMPYLAMALMVLLYGVFNAFKLLFKKNAKYMLIVTVLITAVCSLKHTFERIDILELRKNLNGDMLYGYTPDWYHYLEACQWVEKNLPEDSYVACRKPNMARIYANGKKFYGIYNIPSEDPDVLLDELYKRNVTHVMLASLRRDPLMPNALIINTVHNYLYIILQKYPDLIEPVRAFGNENNEPTMIYSLKKIDRQ